MNVVSDVVGSVEVSEDARTYLPDGLLGFEDLKKFAIVEIEGLLPFRWLVSEEDPTVAFVIVSPYVVYGDKYKVKLAESDRDILDLAPEDTTEMFVLVSLSDETHGITANLKGPVVLNTQNRVAKQVVVYNPAYSFRHLFQDESAQENTDGRTNLRAQVYR
jgi:flagellar assembly factor FliW